MQTRETQVGGTAGATEGLDVDKCHLSGGDGRPRRGPARRLRRGDAELLALLGLCRFLTVKQVVALGRGAKTEQAAGRRLRGLAGEAKGARVGPVVPPVLRAVAFRTFAGEPSQLWGLTTAGVGVASHELGRPLKVPRNDVGAAFAEHFTCLTELFVQLALPHLQAGVQPGALPFRWDVAEEVELPWREKDEVGREKARTIRPDAVLDVPARTRRFFVECEMGTHTLTPLSPDKSQATVRKLERYDAYVSGFADVRARLSHYQGKYPDGWPCEVVFLTRSPGRQRSTQAVVEAFLASHAGTRLSARALTLEQAVAHCAASGATARASTREGGPSSFYGEGEHRAVKDFVLEVTGALAEADARLRRHGLEGLGQQPSRARMLDFLRKAQAEMQRQRREHAPRA
jgi:hypothetical protein